MHASMVRKPDPLADCKYLFDMDLFGIRLFSVCRIRHVLFGHLQVACAQKAKAQVVVAVAGVVPVAVRRPAVLGGVVPRAAAMNPVRACDGHVPFYKIGCHLKICK